MINEKNLKEMLKFMKDKELNRITINIKKGSTILVSMKAEDFYNVGELSLDFLFSYTKNYDGYFRNWFEALAEKSTQAPTQAPEPDQTLEPQNCPFCGGGVDIDNAEGFYWVKCCEESSCEFLGPIRKTEEEAIKAWNRICLAEEEK